MSVYKRVIYFLKKVDLNLFPFRYIIYTIKEVYNPN